MNAQPSLFDYKPLLECRGEAYNKLQPQQLKTCRQAIIDYVSENPLSTYEEIHTGLNLNGYKVKLASIVGRLSELSNETDCKFDLTNKKNGATAYKLKG